MSPHRCAAFLTSFLPALALPTFAIPPADPTVLAPAGPASSAVAQRANDTSPDGPVTSTELVERAWQLLPPYDGEDRAFLTADARREVTAAAHLLEAAAALEPDHVRAVWSLGHARVLLAEDRRNRGELDEAREQHAKAVAALSRAIELAPEDPWALYARGAERTAAGEHATALEDLDRAVESAEARIAAGDTDGSIPWLRFKALEWRAETLMRQGDHERAREELRAFHGEFSNNEFPLHIALAESHLRARDFAGARESYLAILELFPSDHQAYALLGYLAGLEGDAELATRRLQEALERELQPGIYARLWLYLLALDEARPAAEEDLRGFLEHPPGEIPEWDLFLGRFVLGEGTPDAFLAAARDEEARRMDAGEILDDLACEALFYAGWRHEHDAAATDEAGRAVRLRSALDAYRSSLRHSPPKWKWEWAYSRLHFADLARTLALEAGGALLLTDDSPLDLEDGATLVSGVWHSPRDRAPRATLEGEPRPGDLFLARVRKDGRVVPARLVVDTR